MSAPVQSQERREVLNTARRYRRDGYKVSGPDNLSSSKPSFLGDVVPDLIAERDDDKVVIEVKRATAVRGANDLVELAARVAAQPGWRFELIAVPSTTQITMPDLALVGRDVARLLDEELMKPAFIVVFAMIENIVAHAAIRRNRNPANSTFAALVRDLVVQGVIDDETRAKIGSAEARRNAIMHAETEPVPTRDDVEALMKLGYNLEREVLTASGV